MIESVKNNVAPNEQPRKTQVVRRKTIHIYTDGSWLNRKQAGGWSALMVCGNQWQIIYDGQLQTTINRMELSAVLYALKTLTESCNVEIYADSSLTVNTINKWIFGWEKNGFKTKEDKPVANQDLLQELLPLLHLHRVHANWIKAHTKRTDVNSLGNAVVDVFARAAACAIANAHRINNNRSYLEYKFPRVDFPRLVYV